MAQALRLNVFQRLARRWDALHPYNAAQVMQIAGAADLPRLESAWHEALDAMGLGIARVNGRHFLFENLNGQAPPDMVQSVSGVSLENWISSELNRPFADGQIPFRPFVIQENGSHYAGIIYHHWVADSVSIRMLMREWFVRCHDPARGRRTPLRLSDAGYWRLFGPQRGNWRFTEGLLSSIRWTSRFKRVRRIEFDGVGEFAVRFSLHPAPDGLIDRLLPVARNLGITLNDLFLAALAEACDRYVPVKYLYRRQDLALGTIVDLRPMAVEDLSQTFGLFLGFTSVLCRPRDLREWSRLVSTIAAQSRINKETGVSQASAIRMFAGLAVERYLSRSGIVDFYRKRVPLAGGISNVNLTPTWISEYPRLLLDYVRVAPTGPMMPLVLTPTTLGRKFHIGLTRRPATVSDENAQAIAGTFLRRLSSLAT
jgi:hypothetical protein